MTLPVPAGVRFDGAGLVPAVVQDELTGAVLMIAYMDRQALQLTAETGEAHFFSRSRQRLWRKGETSGAVMAVAAIQADCDGDALLISVRAGGPACHLGRRSCFPQPGIVLEQLQETLTQRRQSPPPGSYTAALLEGGTPPISRKVGEEAIEVILAAHQESQGHLVAEVADLWFHSAVLLTARDLQLADVMEELQRRHRAGRSPGVGRRSGARPPGRADASSAG